MEPWLKQKIDEHYARLEQQLLSAVIDKLYRRGRILPGEEIMREPRENGGYVTYEMPDHANASSR